MKETRRACSSSGFFRMGERIRTSDLLAPKNAHWLGDHDFAKINFRSTRVSIAAMTLLEEGIFQPTCWLKVVVIPILLVFIALNASVI